MTRQPASPRKPKYKVLLRQAPTLDDLNAREREKCRALHAELMASPEWVTLNELAVIRKCTRQAVTQWIVNNPKCIIKVVPGTRSSIFVNVADAASLYKPRFWKRDQRERERLEQQA